VPSGAGVVDDQDVGRRHRHPQPPKNLGDVGGFVVGRENGVGFSHSPVRDTAFVREPDPMTRTHYEVGVFTWARGTVRIDGRTLDATVERTP
jgi:hypothetical protein